MPTYPSHGIHGRGVADTPIAVIDFETTGLTAGWDRVVEISVVRIDPGAAPRLVFDTLINPQRMISATDIHGITEADVVGAPTFAEVADHLADHLAGCVVAAYNAYFDIGFLECELGACGYRDLPPYFCLMYLRPMLGIGKRSTLAEACRLHGISTPDAHHSSADTLAAANLWGICLDAMRDQGVSTFGELAALKKYKFADSFARPLLAARAVRAVPPPRVKSRSGFQGSASAGPTPVPEVTPASPTAPPKRDFAALTDHERAAAREYWELLKLAIYDLKVTPREADLLRGKQVALRMNDDQIRALHARAYVSVLTRMLEDKRLDYKECDRLRRLHQCLRELGWAPGD